MARSFKNSISVHHLWHSDFSYLHSSHSLSLLIGTFCVYLKPVFLAPFSPVATLFHGFKLFLLDEMSTSLMASECQLWRGFWRQPIRGSSNKGPGVALPVLPFVQSFKISACSLSALICVCQPPTHLQQHIFTIFPKTKHDSGQIFEWLTTDKG